MTVSNLKLLAFRTGAVLAICSALVSCGNDKKKSPAQGVSTSANLIGTWQSPCTKSEDEYIRETRSFDTSAAKVTTSYYSSSTCSGTSEADMTGSATYTISGNSLDLDTSKVTITPKTQAAVDMYSQVFSQATCGSPVSLAVNKETDLSACNVIKEELGKMYTTVQLSNGKLFLADGEEGKDGKTPQTRWTKINTAETFEKK